MKVWSSKKCPTTKGSKDKDHRSCPELRVVGEALPCKTVAILYHCLRSEFLLPEYSGGNYWPFPSDSSYDQLHLFLTSDLDLKILSVSSHGLGQCFSEGRLETTLRTSGLEPSSPTLGKDLCFQSSSGQWRNLQETDPGLNKCKEAPNNMHTLTWLFCV